jgi:hypothetical protein
MELVAEQPYVIDRNKRDYDDLTTLFAEMVDGTMRTPFEYTVDGNELRANDGSIMRVEFEKGLEAADAIADRNPNLCFEVRRRRIEIDEHYDMLKMTQGRLPNTMIVVSDFPPELMDWQESVGGYNAQRKQTMLRILAWDGHKMSMYSQSLDGSDRQALEAVYASMGQTPREGELLGQRVHLQLDSDEQSQLTDQLMSVYDQSLREQFGGQWYAGKQGGSRLNTYDFVRQQCDLIQYALQQKRRGDIDIYGIAASLQERFEQNARLQPETIIARQQDPFQNIAAETRHASYRAQLAGKVFDACGLTVEASDEALRSQLDEAGYGNKSSESTRYNFSKRMFCVVCQAPPTEHEKETNATKMCGPCGICRGCDKKLSK